MTYKRPLGEFPSMEAVWTAYPSGGIDGDFLTISGMLYVWDVTANQWVTPQLATQPSSRKTEIIDGDLDVHNDLTVGGILKARVVRGRSAFCGLFADEAALRKHYPRPFVGQWALIVVSEVVNEGQVSEETIQSVGEVYICETDGEWTDAGFRGTFDGDIDALLTEIEARTEADAIEENARRAADEAIDYAVITDAEMDEVLAEE